MRNKTKIRRQTKKSQTTFCVEGKDDKPEKKTKITRQKKYLKKVKARPFKEENELKRKLFKIF